jgi:hypothetical protein
MMWLLITTTRLDCKSILKESDFCQNHAQKGSAISDAAFAL